MSKFEPKRHNLHSDIVLLGATKSGLTGILRTWRKFWNLKIGVRAKIWDCPWLMQYLILYRKSEESKGLEEPHVLGAPSLMVLGEGKQNKWEGGRICRSAVQCRSNPPLPRVMRPIIIMTRIDHLPHFLSPILAQDHACTISQPHPIYSAIPWQWLLSTPRIAFFVLPSFRPSKSTAFE